MVSGFPEQTVARRGSLVFCDRKSSVAERERVKPLERMSVFAGNSPTQMLTLMENMGLSFRF
jgi:hypothetical protein